LIEELERRGKNPNDIKMINLELKEIVEKIWMNRRTGKEYQSELNELIYNVLGKVI
jgi:hypothetical protein